MLRHYTKAAVEGDQNQRHAGTKNGLQALIKAKQRKEASGKSVSQIQASSDFMQIACRISAYAHYARTPVLQLKQRTDDFHSC
jgi:hypothetical protein